MKPVIDYGMLTQDETAELAVAALEELTLDKRVQAVLAAFDYDEREELGSWLGKDEQSADQGAPVEGTPSASGTGSTG